jgi:hypothetical protein
MDEGPSLGELGRLIQLLRSDIRDDMAQINGRLDRMVSTDVYGVEKAGLERDIAEVKRELANVQAQRLQDVERVTQTRRWMSSRSCCSWRGANREAPGSSAHRGPQAAPPGRLPRGRRRAPWRHPPRRHRHHIRRALPRSGRGQSGPGCSRPAGPGPGGEARGGAARIARRPRAGHRRFPWALRASRPDRPHRGIRPYRGVGQARPHSYPEPRSPRPDRCPRCRRPRLRRARTHRASRRERPARAGRHRRPGPRRTGRCTTPGLDVHRRAGRLLPVHSRRRLRPRPPALHLHPDQPALSLGEFEPTPVTAPLPRQCPIEMQEK